jgi:hypothetical protein
MTQESPSPPAGDRDLRTLRLLDLAPHEAIIVRCECGRITEYGHGLLQRLHRVPSDTLIYDLQFRLRCRHCNRRDGFDIGILDTRYRGNSAQPRVERFIVAKEG